MLSRAKLQVNEAWIHKSLRPLQIKIKRRQYCQPYRVCVILRVVGTDPRRDDNPDNFPRALHNNFSEVFRIAGRYIIISTSYSYFQAKIYPD